MRSARSIALPVIALAVTVSAAFAQAPVAYRLTFPEPEHRWMQVELTLADLPDAPLELHMSRVVARTLRAA